MRDIDELAKKILAFIPVSNLVSLKRVGKSGEEQIELVANSDPGFMSLIDIYNYFKNNESQVRVRFWDKGRLTIILTSEEYAKI